MRATVKICNIVLAMLFLILSLFACTDRNNTHLLPGDNKNSFIIPYLGLKYTLPDKGGHWLVAQQNLTSSNIYFCAVDTLTNECVTIVHPGNLNSGDRELTRHEVNVLINDLIKNPDLAAENFSVAHQEIKKCKYLNLDAFKFDVNLEIERGSDKMSIKYCGYFFLLKEKIIGIMLISPAHLLENSDEGQIQNIFYNLTLANS